MIINPLTNLPYENEYDPVKLYQDILFNNGVNLQSRELNELLSLVAEKIKLLGQTLYNDGSIINGGGVIITDKDVKILDIKIYIAGIIHSIPTTNLVITGIGTEILGVKLTGTVVNYVSDPSLLDPAPGPNFGLPGADRYKMVANWTINDPEAYPVYTLIDGILNIEKYTPESDALATWMARRTNDESGSYTVSGLTATVSNYDADNLQLIVEAGKGYILGWEVSKPSPTKLRFPKSKSTRSVVNETKTYTTDTTFYAINSQPVSAIQQLTAQVQRTLTMTRGAITGTIDTIPLSPVSSIVSITDYAPNTDYKLTGDGVDWSPGGSEPAPGSTYTITFVYTKIMTAGTDYELETVNNINGVKFLASDLPVTGTNFQYNYTFYLARRDIFYITKDGTISINYGTPSVIPPLATTPIGVLNLGEILVSPNSNDVVVTNYDSRRLTMSEIKNIRDRLDRNEYNAAIEDLDNLADRMDPVTTKRGIFTDGFLNEEKIDFGLPTVKCAIDPADGLLLPPFIQTSKDPVVNDTGTARVHNRIATKPYTEIVSLSQLNSTQLMNINPYMVYNKAAIITVTPNQDNWVESNHTTEIVYRWWNNFITGTTSRVNGSWNSTTTTNTLVGTRTTTSVSSKLILDNAILTMRQRILTINGTQFLPYSDNIKCTFDEIPVDLTIGNIGSAGAQAGTIRADADGNFEATFTIPAGVSTGTRQIVIWNEV